VSECTQCSAVTKYKQIITAQSFVDGCINKGNAGIIQSFTYHFYSHEDGGLRWDLIPYAAQQSCHDTYLTKA
jgi:hypothetical protein